MIKWEKYQSIVGRVNYILFLIAVASLPFPQVFSRYALVAWFVAWVLELRWVHKPINSFSRSGLYALPILLFGLWYVWRAISGFWSPDHRAWSFMMERYMTFGLLVPVALWGVNERYDWRMPAKVLAVSCVTAALLYAILLLVHYDTEQLKHRLFLCSAEIMGAVAAYEVWRKKPQIWIPMVVVMLSTIPLTGSRQSVITLAVAITLAVIYALPEKHRWLYGIMTVVIGIAIGCGIFFTHPRMKTIMADELTIEQLTKHEPRVGIWSIALKEPEFSFWKGLGGGQSVNYLEKQYNKFYMKYYKDHHYHAHNQYLEEFMELGYFGLLFFILAWLSVLVCAKDQGRKIAVYFVAVYGLNMFTDCMWGKFDGIALWAVMMLIIYLASRPHFQRL